MERRDRSLFVAMMRERKAPGGGALWSLRRGMGALVDALAASAGASLRLRAPVLGIEPLQDGARARWRVALASGESVDADAVVLAVPPKAAGALLRPLYIEAARHLASIPVAGLAVVALALRREAFRRAPEGYGFLVVPGEPLEILGALFESNLFPERAPEGRVLVRVMLGGVERPDLVTRSDAELAGLALQALDRALGLKTGPDRTWVIRQPEAIPQYEVGHRTLLGAVESRLEPMRGIVLTGNGYRGVSVAALAEDAERVASRVLERA